MTVSHDPAYGKAADSSRVQFPESIIELAPPGAAASASQSIRPKISRSRLQPAESTAVMTFEIALRMRNIEDLQQRVAKSEVVPFDERSAKYFPLEADYEAVATWLTSEGFAVTRRSTNRLTIFASGTVSQIEASFQTAFARVAADGAEYTSAIAAPSVPAAIASTVLGINGLQPHLRPRRYPVTSPIKTNSLTSNAPPYLPSQIATAYGATGLTVDGTGQTIGIVIDSLPSAADLNSFRQACGIGGGRVDYYHTQNFAPPTDTEGEATLDVEWSGAIATGANVLVFTIPSLTYTNMDLAYQQIAEVLPNQPGLHQVSLSYGGAESGLPASQRQTETQLFLNLTSSGVTVFASSGDGGSNPSLQLGKNGFDSTAPVQANYPASDPNITSVGGTALVLSAFGGVVSETSWFSNGGGTGGGISKVFARPSWQTGLGVPNVNFRMVPDVAAAGDPSTGAFVVHQGKQLTIGGTSWSSPMWAGFCALINQGRANVNRKPLGALNPELYQFLGVSGYFRDITAGTNGAYNAGVGYDFCTGIGTPNLGNLISYFVNRPEFANSPVDQRVFVGQKAVFTQLVTGLAPITYQWERYPSGGSAWILLSDSATYSGTHTATLTIATTTTAMNGDLYACVANNSWGSIAPTSGYASLFVSVPTVVTAPQIQTQPKSTAVNAGQAATFSVAATGTPAPAYQWQKNGTNISGATNSTLVISSVQPADAGTYTVVVTNNGGLVASSSATLAVNFSRLINVSTRGLVQAGSPLTPGFVMRGSGAKQLIIRAVGPTLSVFGVGGVLSDAKLDVIPLGGSNVLISNDGWGGSASLSNAFSSVGAFALPSASKDSAVQAGLVAGAYTVRVSPGGVATSGVALAEIYDADPIISPVRLVNVSTLGFVGTGANALSPGFVIRGNLAKQLLIRAVGPGLTQFGVGGILADPQLQVIPAGQAAAIASNDNWGGSATLKSAFTQAGAFIIADTSKDAAVLVSLAPGGYTVVVSGVGNTTGNALVEIYDLDP